ncbi:MAG: hypothetical protein ACLFRR_03975 [Spirochaetaceae bacterium]
MKKRFRGAFVVIPVVYAGIILLLLYLQFSDGQSFFESTDGLTVSGRMTPTVERESSTVASIRVSYRGLDFAFSKEEPLSITREDGGSMDLAPRSYAVEERGYRVSFEEEVVLLFELAGEKDTELQVRADIPERLLPASSVAIPVSAADGARFAEARVSGIYPVRYESATYNFAPPPQASVDTDAGTLTLPGTHVTNTVRYRPAEGDGPDVFETYFAEDDDSHRIDDEEYEETLSEYIDDAYRGWTESRFNGGDGTWDTREGSAVFTEKALIATLAEAWQRDDYDSVFTDMRRAADEHPDSISLLSAPYLGNLREIRERFLEEDRAKTQELLTDIEEEDLDLFRTRNLPAFAVDRGSEELYEELIDFVATVDYQDADMPQAVGMAAASYRSDQPTEELDEAFARLGQVVDAKIVPALYRVEDDDGIFLERSPGRVDVALSVQAGRVLESVGEQRQDQRLVSAGRNLVASALGLADDAGFVPEVLHVGNGELEGAEGNVPPEELYELLNDNPAYPRRISLAEELDPGSWILTAADFTDIEIEEDEYRFALRYPRNRTHYVLMQGIPEFSEMELFGQTWRNDPSFEAYSRGRHYNDDSETLMIKYTDNSTEGEIVLRY